MKKLLSFLIALSLVLGVGIAMATDVSDVPQPGLYKSHLSSTQKPGASCVIGNSQFRYVYNATATTEYQGHPAFYNPGAQNDYTVGRYDNTSSYECFAGVWYCDAFGGDEVAASAYGWIQDAGYCNYAYVSAEAGQAITVGDVLTGSTNCLTASASYPTGTAGCSYLTWARDLKTSKDATTEAAVLTWPRAAAAQAGAHGGTANKIVLRSRI